MRNPCGWAALLSGAIAACSTAPDLTRYSACLSAPGRQVSLRILPADEVMGRLEALEVSNPARAERIEQLFEEAGCGDRLRTSPVDDDDQPNVLCEIAGQGDRVIVVGAHYDKVEIGQGAIDNWSGVALLPSLFRTLTGVAPRHTLRFVAFAAEESGLRGSRAYLEQLPDEERSRIVAMVNLDTLGLGSPGIEFQGADPDLVCWCVLAARAAGVDLRAVNTYRIGTSDHQSFREAGIPAVILHSLSQDTLSVMHSEEDTLARVDRPAYLQTYRLLAFYLGLLDQSLTLDPPRDEAPPAAGREADGTLSHS